MILQVLLLAQNLFPDPARSLVPSSGRQLPRELVGLRLGLGSLSVAGAQWSWLLAAVLHALRGARLGLRGRCAQRRPVSFHGSRRSRVLFRVLRAHMHPQTIRRMIDPPAVLALRRYVLSGRGRFRPLAVVTAVLSEGSLVFVRLAAVRALDSFGRRHLSLPLGPRSSSRIRGRRPGARAPETRKRCY